MKKEKVKKFLGLVVVVLVLGSVLLNIITLTMIDELETEIQEHSELLELQKDVNNAQEKVNEAQKEVNDSLLKTDESIIKTLNSMLSGTN